MRVDFYQLSQSTPEAVVPLLARATLQAGERLLVVAEDEELRSALSDALWAAYPDAFLANGDGGSEAASRQPVLLSGDCEAENAAQFILFADGKWRDEAKSFARTLLVFGEDRLEDTRGVWRMLDEVEGAERHFWKQEGGKWREGP
ncbi:DNA polymerase III subunit chi [Altererythrobacter sp. MF3-039]|uniref:DNA polymerase III subunit chi n=1 Tax=Altererythrobacter sp. MF3-039 TaxID=3252901 RepID=UPI00390C5CBA